MIPDFLLGGTPAAVLAALPGARAVGGAVRDHLAGRAIHDVDVAVPLPPGTTSRLLRAAGLKVVETGLQHGTVTAVLDRQPVEVTSLRRDVVTDGRHAEVAWTADWEEDAARRDFTINAMSMSADGKVHDFFGGRADLAAGRVRFVGDARQRLAEDYLRALRFFRFWARYGRGEPDADAMAAIREAVPGLARLSVERVWMEMKRLLAAEDPSLALQLMANTGVLPAILHENVLEGFPTRAPDPEAMTTLHRLHAPQHIFLRFAALTRSMTPLELRVGPMGERYPFSTVELLAITDLLAPWDLLRAGHSSLQDTMITPADGDLLDTKRFRIGRGMSGDIQHTQWLSTYLVEGFGADLGLDRTWSEVQWAQLRQRLVNRPIPTLPLKGRDVVALKVQPGWQVGQFLGEVERWWIEGRTIPDLEACLAKLRDLVARHNG